MPYRGSYGALGQNPYFRTRDRFFDYMDRRLQRKDYQSQQQYKGYQSAIQAAQYMPEEDWNNLQSEIGQWSAERPDSAMWNAAMSEAGARRAKSAEADRYGQMAEGVFAGGYDPRAEGGAELNYSEEPNFTEGDPAAAGPGRNLSAIPMNELMKMYEHSTNPLAQAAFKQEFIDRRAPEEDFEYANKNLQGLYQLFQQGVISEEQWQDAAGDYAGQGLTAAQEETKRQHDERQDLSEDTESRIAAGQSFDMAKGAGLLAGQGGPGEPGQLTPTKALSTAIDDLEKAQVRVGEMVPGYEPQIMAVNIQARTELAHRLQGGQPVRYKGLAAELTDTQIQQVAIFGTKQARAPALSWVADVYGESEAWATTALDQRYGELIRGGGRGSGMTPEELRGLVMAKMVEMALAKQQQKMTQEGEMYH